MKINNEYIYNFCHNERKKVSRQAILGPNNIDEKKVFDISKLTKLRVIVNGKTIVASDNLSNRHKSSEKNDGINNFIDIFQCHLKRNKPQSLKVKVNNSTVGPRTGKVGATLPHNEPFLSKKSKLQSSIKEDAQGMNIQKVDNKRIIVERANIQSIEVEKIYSTVVNVSKVEKRFRLSRKKTL